MLASTVADAKRTPVAGNTILAPCVPAEVFTTCLTSPVHAALTFYGCESVRGSRRNPLQFGSQRELHALIGRNDRGSPSQRIAPHRIAREAQRVKSRESTSTEHM